MRYDFELGYFVFYFCCRIKYLDYSFVVPTNLNHQEPDSSTCIRRCLPVLVVEWFRNSDGTRGRPYVLKDFQDWAKLFAIYFNTAQGEPAKVRSSFLRSSPLRVRHSFPRVSITSKQNGVPAGRSTASSRVAPTRRTIQTKSSSSLFKMHPEKSVAPVNYGWQELTNQTATMG